MAEFINDGEFSLLYRGEAKSLPDWLEKEASREFVYNGGEPGGEGVLNLKVMIGNAGLYGYFPFSVWIYCDDQPACVIEFTEGQQTRNVRVQAIAGKVHRLRFISELSGSPHALGLGADTRNLSILILAATWETKAHPVRNPALKSYDPKFNSICDHDDIHPVFVIGSYRSATSIATWVIGQHPDIFPLEENGWTGSKYHFARATYLLTNQASRSAAEVYDVSESDFLRFEGANIHRLNANVAAQKAFRGKMLGVSEGAAGGFKQYNPRFEMMRSFFAPKKRWIDGTPENTEVALGLSRMFPNAKFIYMIRPPRAVISSLMNFDTMGEIAYSFEAAADTWERLNYRAYEALTQLGPQRVCLSLFDQFNNSPATIIDSWWNFLDEPCFDAAIDTCRQKINSSGEREIDAELIDTKRLDRLNMIYTGILASKPIGSLPWTMTFDPIERRERNLSVRFLEVLGFSDKAITLTPTV